MSLATVYEQIEDLLDKTQLAKQDLQAQKEEAEGLLMSLERDIEQLLLHAVVGDLIARERIRVLKKIHSSVREVLNGYAESEGAFLDNETFCRETIDKLERECQTL